jgi:hypothetical protein
LNLDRAAHPLIRKPHYILSVLLALILAVGNIAFSGHVSSHTASDFGSCSFCSHMGRTDNAVTPQVSLTFVIPAAFKFRAQSSPSPILKVILRDQQSRAPPSLT